MPALSLQSIHTIVLASACFFGTTVFAFVLLFAAVVMPGLDAYDNDADYLRAFQVIDGVIQNNEPWFILSWMGSMLSAVALAAVSLRLSATSLRRRVVMVIFCVIFLVGHIITVTKHIPLNNQLHSLNLDQTSADTLASMRQDFTTSWCAWNVVRTFLFGISSIYWLTVLVLTDTPDDFKKAANFESPPEVEARFNQVV
jgi:uncharacterized membrane protein